MFSNRQTALPQLSTYLDDDQVFNEELYCGNRGPPSLVFREKCFLGENSIGKCRYYHCFHSCFENEETRVSARPAMGLALIEIQNLIYVSANHLYLVLDITAAQLPTCTLKGGRVEGGGGGRGVEGEGGSQ